MDDLVVDQSDKLAAGESPNFWRAQHWGMFPDPEVDDDDPERYAAAAEALTERVCEVAGITDGTVVLDVGCGFGGTIDHIAARNSGCGIVGLNIDERQLRNARKLIAADGRAASPDTPMVTADACRLPFAGASFDHVLAIECAFHFPSRKAFFTEAARVLRPGGTLAMTDFVLAAHSHVHVMENLRRIDFGNFYGSYKTPMTSAGNARLAHRCGMDVLVDDDITRNTLPTYPALRNIYEQLEMVDAVKAINGCEELARAGGWEYHVLAFRKR